MAAMIFFDDRDDADDIFDDDGDDVFDDGGVLKEVVGLEAEVDERTLCTHTNFHKSECWWR